jgi:hypothetical protein
MDQRTESFARRFRSAEAHLGAQDLQDVVSLKFRHHYVNGPDYSQFINNHLTRNLGFDVARLDGEFGGQGWLVTDKSQNRAILVEHETGLEILGAIGSVASLIALLPVIGAGWTSLRSRFFPSRFDRPDFDAIEVRRFDHNDVLIEQHSPSVEVYVLNTTLQDYARLRQEVDQLKAQIESLQKQLPASNKKGTVRPRGKRNRRK